jgi:hypothetical protein
MKLQLDIRIRFSDAERRALNVVAARCKPQWLFGDEAKPFEQVSHKLLRDERTWNLAQLRHGFHYLKHLHRHYTDDLNRPEQEWFATGHVPNVATAASIQIIREARTEQLDLIKRAGDIIIAALTIIDPEVYEDEEPISIEPE